MGDVRYIHVRNWDRFQHPDTLRGTLRGAGGLPWIRDYTAQLGDEEWLQLSLADRGLLQSIRLQYGATRGRGLIDSTSSLARVLGQRVLRVQLDRLNHAGFIEFHASKLLADCKYRQRQDLDRDRESDRQSLSLNTTNKEQNHSGNVADRLLTEIRDANNRTRDAIHKFEQRGLPDAAFATALESLQHRRKRTDRKPLTSEARYVVAALTTMEREGQYAQ